MNGILGTQAPLWTDLWLIGTVLLGLIASYGAFQARKKQFSKHCPVVAVAAFLNWIPVIFLLLPTSPDFIAEFEASLAGFVGSLPLIHLVLAVFTQILMTYTVVRMYWMENLPPQKPKILMKATMSFWFLVVAVGVGVYLIAF